MEINKIHEKLKGHFGETVVTSVTEADKEIRDPFITVLGSRVDKVCLFCKVDPDLDFDFCQSITGMDTGDTFTCVYHLYSYSKRHTLVLKVTTPRDEATLPSCVVAWPVVDWYERETAEMFGIQFSGHPDLRPLLLPEGWQGYPMRKDYVEQPQYLGMPTTRENPLDLLDEEQ